MKAPAGFTDFALLLTVLFSPAGRAQAPTVPSPAIQPPSSAKFEYAATTIKPVRSEGVESYWSTRPDGFTQIGSPLRLIMVAYAVEAPSQIVGLPAWATSEKFQIEAKMDAENAAALARLPMKEKVQQQRLMLQAVLADRFALQMHRSSKESQCYVLTVLDANKLKRSAGDKSQSTTYTGKVTAQAMSIDSLTVILTNTLGRLVLNQTALAGAYDFTLEWAPEGADASDTRPSIFTALQEQMGLKLKSAEGPVDAILVDSIARPSAD